MSGLRFTDETEVAEIFLAGLIAQGRVSREAVVRVRVENLTAFAMDVAPPAVVVDILGTRQPGGARA